MGRLKACSVIRLLFTPAWKSPPPNLHKPQLIQAYDKESSKGVAATPFRLQYSVCQCSGRRFAARSPFGRWCVDAVRLGAGCSTLRGRHSALGLGLGFLAVGRGSRAVERFALVPCLFPMNGISPCRIALFFPEGVCTFLDPLFPSFCHR
ncbi:hypothetical protein RHECNPAF_1260023 [Rhizobium etli CNPAF512]|nr:hypothetical protein RHECNPAF_1260023 [Rhizobium etli CNPAF512]